MIDPITPPATSPLTRSPSERIPELDGLRGVAILLVLIWHYFVLRFAFSVGPAWKSFWAIFALSWSGVDLFFVLSGFLIGGILMRYRDSPNYFKTFYVRRVCRIVPLYFLVLAGCAIAISLNAAAKSEPLKWLFDRPMPLWSYATFLQNFAMLIRGDFGANSLAPTWSLAIEEQFYLLFPLIVRYSPRSLLPYLLGFCIALAPAVRIVFFLFYPIPAAGSFFLMPCRMDALGLGALAAWLLRSKRAVATLRKKPGWLGVSGFIAILGYVFLTFLAPDPAAMPIVYWGRSLLALSFVCILIVTVVQRDGVLAKIFRNRLLRGLGVISYGVYLVHLLAIGLLDAFLFRGKWHARLSSHLLLILMALALTMISATLLYRFFEQPILRFGHRFRY